jgi:hypothetical protein
MTCAFFQLEGYLHSKLEEENVPLPDFDIKTNNVINEIFVTISEIVDILMQKTTTIGFIGAGNMAYALISGLINNGLEASNIKLSDGVFGIVRTIDIPPPSQALILWLLTPAAIEIIKGLR